MSGNFKEALAVWKGDMVFDATPESGFTIRMDGDSKQGVGPMEMILMGLMGCMGADVASILQKKRQMVTALEIRAHGDRAPEHPRKYIHIELVFVVTGRNIEPDAVRRAIELSEEKYCSVSATLRGTAQIITRFEIRESELVMA